MCILWQKTILFHRGDAENAELIIFLFSVDPAKRDRDAGKQQEANISVHHQHISCL